MGGQLNAGFLTCFGQKETPESDVDEGMLLFGRAFNKTP